MKILIVDDELVIAELLTEILSIWGHDVDYTSSSLEAYGKLLKKPYDIVFSDLNMDEMSGNDLRLKIQSEIQHPPKFVLTTAMNAEKTAEETGYFLILEKPFKMVHVKDILQRL